MIKANELRLNNMFNYWPIGSDMILDKVIALRNKSKSFAQRLIKGEKSGWMQETQCHPIELTPSLLEKVGFEWYNPLSQWRIVERDQWYSIKKVQFDIPKEELFCFSWCNLAVNESEQMPSKIVTHLHELQNLYYEISEEELPIELTQVERSVATDAR